MLITGQLLDVDYKAGTTRKRIRQKVPNERDTQEAYLNTRDKRRITITIFYTILGKLATEMKRRGEIYKEIADVHYIMSRYHLLTLKDILSAVKS